MGVNPDSVRHGQIKSNAIFCARTFVCLHQLEHEVQMRSTQRAQLSGGHPVRRAVAATAPVATPAASQDGGPRPGNGPFRGAGRQPTARRPVARQPRAGRPANDDADAAADDADADDDADDDDDEVDDDADAQHAQQQQQQQQQVQQLQQQQQRRRRQLQQQGGGSQVSGGHDSSSPS